MVLKEKDDWHEKADVVVPIVYLASPGNCHGDLAYASGRRGLDRLVMREAPMQPHALWSLGHAMDTMLEIFTRSYMSLLAS